MRRLRTSSPVLKVCHVDLNAHKRIINRYAHTLALHDSYKVELEKVGWFLKIASFGQLEGIKTLDYNVQEFESRKRRVLDGLRANISGMLGNPKNGMMLYYQYLNLLQDKTRHLQVAMDKLRNEVMKHNSEESRIASDWHKTYAQIKLGADTVIAVGSVMPGTSAVSLGYAAVTEGIAVWSDPRTADAFAFKGTGGGVVFAATEVYAKKVLTEKGLKVIVRGPAAIISVLFAVNDYQKAVNN